MTGSKSRGEENQARWCCKVTGVRFRFDSRCGGGRPVDVCCRGAVPGGPWGVPLGEYLGEGGAATWSAMYNDFSTLTEK